jgi:hypothetical protein
VVSVDTVTVPSLLPTDDATLVGYGVGSGVGEMHSLLQTSGHLYLFSLKQTLGVSQLKLLSFVHDVGDGVSFGVGRGVGLFVGLGVG